MNYHSTDLRYPEHQISSVASPIQQLAPEQSYMNYRVPDGTAKAVAVPEPVRTEKPVDVKPTSTDSLAADANPTEFPAGSPAMKPFMKLGFRKRSEFTGALDPLLKRIDSLRPTTSGETKNVGPAEASQMYELMADIDDLLRPCAVDPDAYEAWISDVEDNEFMQFFMAYFSQTQPGEAASSSS